MRLTERQIDVSVEHSDNLNAGLWPYTISSSQLWIDMLNKIINPIKSQE